MYIHLFPSISIFQAESRVHTRHKITTHTAHIDNIYICIINAHFIDINKLKQIVTGNYIYFR